jgi:hypothetical protein
MRTSFHHQPEAQHPIFQLSTSWQADYPIFRSEADIQGRVALISSVANDPKRTLEGPKSRSAAIISVARQESEQFRFVPRTLPPDRQTLPARPQ